MNTIKSKIISGTFAAMVITALTIVPVFAASKSATISSTKKTDTEKQEKRTEAVQTRGIKEIDMRVDSLNKLIGRIQELRNVSESQKISIITTIQGLVTSLSNLKVQMIAETSSTTLKADTKAITQNYRIYALAIPQLNIFAAADRIVTVAAMLEATGIKLQTRLSQASSTPNIIALQASLVDLGQKIADAVTNAQAAVALVSPLVSDQGDKVKMESNNVAMKNARAKIQAAQKDLVAARKDADTIIKGLIKYEKSTSKKLPETKKSSDSI